MVVFTITFVSSKYCVCILSLKGWTPLMYAVKENQLEILTELVETDVLDYSITNKVRNH